MNIPTRGEGDPSLEWMVWMYQTRQIRYREREIRTLRQRCEDAAVEFCGTLWGSALWYMLEWSALDRLDPKAARRGT